MKSDTFAPVPNRGLITISIVLANIMQGVDNSKRRTAAAGPTRSPQVRQVIGKLDELRIVERLQHLQHYRLVSVQLEGRKTAFRRGLRSSRPGWKVCVGPNLQFLQIRAGFDGESGKEHGSRAPPGCSSVVVAPRAGRGGTASSNPLCSREESSNPGSLSDVSRSVDLRRRRSASPTSEDNSARCAQRGASPAARRRPERYNQYRCGSRKTVGHGPQIGNSARMPLTTARRSYPPRALECLGDYAAGRYPPG